jgi:hypothetical protein
MGGTLMCWFGRRRADKLRCRDVDHHGHRLAVRPQVDTGGGPRVALAVDDGTPLLLTPLQVGRLRAELRDAVLAAEKQHTQLAERAAT